MLERLAGAMSAFRCAISYIDPDCYFGSSGFGKSFITKILALFHYSAVGWKNGRDPSSTFCTSAYFLRNPDVSDSLVNPLFHYCLWGRVEGRDFHKFTDKEIAKISGYTVEQIIYIKSKFDEDFYLRKNRIKGIYSGALFEHYMLVGWKYNFDPCPWFDASFYVDAYRDIRDAKLNPFCHYLLHGCDEGRATKYARIDLSDALLSDIGAIDKEFDSDFYVENHPEVVGSGYEPIVHYVVDGWKKGYDPCPWFSTNYYMERYPDIKSSGMNPFVHYCLYGRGENRETSYYIEKKRDEFRPLVSAIVPNYNHAEYLKDRILSILEQTYSNIEIIILDDASDDDSVDVIKSVTRGVSVPVYFVFNSENSGNVFSQWKRGVELAKGEIIWICESDDFCERDFLEKVVGYFSDLSINMVFGRVQFSDLDGNFVPGLDAYRERACNGIWDSSFCKPAKWWFDNAFGVLNVIPNVGGCVFRNIKLDDSVWEKASNFRICGDWYLYIHIAFTGKIAYEKSAVSYFRQHLKNTSASNFNKIYYYNELVDVLTEIRRVWNIRRDTVDRFITNMRAQYEHNNMESICGRFEDFLDRRMVSLDPCMHIQIAFLGFHIGGGELFPINLANSLRSKGVLVSLLALDLNSINDGMASCLSSGIPVYHAYDVAKCGRASHFSECGVSLVNSHMVSCDTFFFDLSSGPMEVPYIVTMHGSHVSIKGLRSPMTSWLIDNVNLWIYTAERNLEFFDSIGVPRDSLSLRKITNGMPSDSRDVKFSWSDLGISSPGVVFAFIARGLEEKGWIQTVRAFIELSKRRDDVVLLMVGEGEAVTRARDIAKSHKNIVFLGYISEINGLLRISDCLVFASRFEGESYPLCVIQSLQESIPVIATDVGEVGDMVGGDDGEIAGIIVDPSASDAKLVRSLFEAMDRMCDPEFRARASCIAEKKGKRFDMEAVASKYISAYSDMLI